MSLKWIFKCTVSHIPGGFLLFAPTPEATHLLCGFASLASSFFYFHNVRPFSNVNTRKREWVKNKRKAYKELHFLRTDVTRDPCRPESLWTAQKQCSFKPKGGPTVCFALLRWILVSHEGFSRFVVVVSIPCQTAISFFTTKAFQFGIRNLHLLK